MLCLSKTVSNPWRWKLYPKQPQIRSCLVFKPSILGSNILNYSPGKLTCLQKRDHETKKLKLSSSNHQFSGDMFVFTSLNLYKFLLELVHLGKKYTKKSDSPMRARGSHVIGRYIYIYIISYGAAMHYVYNWSKLQVYVTSMYMNGNLWCMWCLGNSNHSSSWFLTQSMKNKYFPATVLPLCWRTGCAQGFSLLQEPDHDLFSLRMKPTSAALRSFSCPFGKVPACHGCMTQLNSECHVLTFLPYRSGKLTRV